MYGTYWLGFGASKIFIFNVQYMSIIMILYVQTSFMIIIHVSVHLSLTPIIIISHTRSSPIIIIIDVLLVIFWSGAWIVLGSNTDNANSIPPPWYLRATPSHNYAIIVASSLWLIFFNKRKGGYSQWPLLIWSIAVCYRRDIGYPISWTPG